MPDIIVKSRFLEIGKQAPKRSRFKGIITQKSIIGWSKYTGRSSAKTQQDLGDRLSCHEDGFLGYTSRSNATSGTYSYLGWINKDNRKTLIQDLYKATDHDGAILYDTVISLKNYELADKAHLKNHSDYANICKKILPQFLKKMGLDPDNVIWWEDQHTNTMHPHMHLCFIEKNQTRTRGKLTQKQLDQFQLLFAKEINSRLSNKESKDYLQSKDKAFTDLLFQITSDTILNLNTVHDTVLQLYQKLPTAGRLQYGSSAMMPYREEIDEITTAILSSQPLKTAYDDYMQKVDDLEKEMQKATGKTGNIRTAETKKLMKQCGNLILQQFKNPEFINEINNLERPLQKNKSDAELIEKDEDLIDNLLDEDSHFISHSAKTCNTIWDYFNKDYQYAKKLMFGTDEIKQNLNEALKWLKQEADKGNPLAMSDIGNVLKSKKISVTGTSEEWYKRSLERFIQINNQKENEYCRYRIGKMYQYGLGVDQDFDRAMNNYQVSQNYKFSQFALGTLYQYGNGVEKDCATAYAWYLKSYHNGNPMGAYKAAELIRSCDVTESRTKMQELYQSAYQSLINQSISGADERIEYILGKMKENGLGTEKSSVDAFQHYHKAAQNGNADAAYKAAELIQRGKIKVHGDEQEHLYKLALDAYLKEFESNKSDKIAYRLAVLYYYGKGTHIKLEEAVKYASVAAARNNAPAMFLLSKIYLSLNKISESLYYLKLSADKGNDFAQYRYGMYLMRGQYIDKNPALAIEYLKKAAASNNIFALRYLDKTQNTIKPIKKLGKFVNGGVRSYLAKRSAEIERDIEKYLYGDATKE
ncbi:relaxase MobL [Holdemania massiliensis]|uniref:relaxase MobL n=1 Tax=Holdemania massiliensis TaxID=1468449 RepID=UPI001F0631D0|nr:relaxase MobL [Holdemania massiliensis]MCH1942412.1 relaxase MobL [Holdemania massiliensis]